MCIRDSSNNRLGSYPPTDGAGDMAGMLEAFGMCCGLEQDQHIESALALSRANLDALKTKGGLVVPGSQVRREGGPFSRPKVQCLIACVGVGGALRSPLSHLTDLALGRGGSPAWGVLLSLIHI